MTTFDERIRALRWGRELLEDLAADPSTSPERLKLVTQLLEGYPEAESIESRLEDLEGDALLAAVQLVEQVIGVLESLRWDPDRELAEQARRVARHYPTRWEMTPWDRKGTGDASAAIRTLDEAFHWAAFYLDRPPGRSGWMHAKAGTENATAPTTGGASHEPHTQSNAGDS